MSKRIQAVALVIGVLALSFACGSDEGQGGQDSDAAVGGGDGGGTDSSSPSVDAAPPTGNDVVPSSAADLNAYLQANNYSEFAAEPALHPTAGPHMSMVRTFFNSTLDASIRGGASDHPVGSAIVKELYNGGGVLGGWAVMVKTANSGDTPANDWYFYEVLSTTPGAAPVLEGNGVGGCAGCHSSGTDYIRSNYP